MIENIDMMIDGIPAILWGEPSDKLFIAVHGISIGTWGALFSYRRTAALF